LNTPPYCQFEVPESELLSIDGELWCEYHAPIENKNMEKIEKGSWDGDAIKIFNKKVLDFTNKNKDRCDLTGVIYPGVITFPEREYSFISFDRTRFHDVASFNGCIFKAHVPFRNAEFNCSHVWFSKAKFIGGSALFHYTHFRGGVWFDGTDFSGGADFSSVIFSGWANFSASRGFDSDSGVFGSISFDNSVFNKESPIYSLVGVTFENREFLHRTSFRNCTFEEAPEFHGCTLHQDTIFPSEEYFTDIESDGAASAYRTLKLAMENARSRNEEAMFYALEQKSLRNRDDTPRLVKFTSYLYETFPITGRASGGRSFGCWW
jgi:hypothetical protein